jgi:hypothetical protein
MPKQLKIIVDENYSPNAPFTVNFAAPVIVEPGNKIALDKFTAVINGITSGFTLPNSTFTFYYSLNSPNFASSTVNILGQRYDNILQLLNNLTTGCNNTFTAYQTGYLPQTTPPTIYRDLGLKVLCSAATNTATATTNTFQIQYATSPLSALNMNSADLTAGVGGFSYPTTTDWSISQVDETVPLLQGGGCLVRFQFQMPSIGEAQANGSAWDIGVIDTLGNYHGLFQNEFGEVFLQNGENSLTEVPIESFPLSVVGGDQYYCEIYQVGGQFALRYYLLNANNTQTETFNSNTSHPGALGPFSYTETYLFQSQGTLQDDISPVPGIKVGGILMTSDIAMTVNTPSAVNRTIGFDMSNAGSLRAGLDVPGGLNILTPINSPLGAFLCQASINMAIVNSSFDIAIEILDLPLQTYQASTSRKPGERNNVVAYFHPEFSQVGTGTYIYDSKAYQWLDIDISYPINLSSLSFRVYDPDTGTGLDALSMSFNLLISTEQY